MQTVDIKTLFEIIKKSTIKRIFLYKYSVEIVEQICSYVWYEP